MPKNSEILPLTNELIYRRFSLNRDKRAQVFDVMTRPEYIALHFLVDGVNPEDVYSNKIYLSDLAERMEASIQAVSDLATDLKGKGFVKWSHDGAGEEGTYVIITQSGYRTMEEQEEHVRNHYAKVIQEFGKDRLTVLLEEMKELDEIMDQVSEEEGGKLDEKELLE